MDSHKYEKLQLHFIYWVGILAAALIFMIVQVWTPEPKFTEYLSNVATMASLVLALVAIFYSFISNDGLSKSMGNISAVASDISVSKDEMRTFLGQAESYTSQSSENTKSLQVVAKTVEAGVAELGQKLLAMESQTSALHSLVSVFPSRFDQLESKFGEKVANGLSHSEVPVVFSNETITNFLERVSVGTNLLVYGISLSKPTGIPVSLKDLAPFVEQTPGYLMGIVSVMHGITLINREYVTGQSRTYRITEMNERLQSAALPYLESYLKRLEPEERAELEAKIANIAKLFQSD